MSVLLIQGDARSIPLADRSVHCVVTSPPYWGLRDYGVEGQLGLERTPDEYIRSMVEVFREVKRVLRDDGTLWLNMGDSYAGSWGNYGGKNRGSGTQRDILRGSQVENSAYDELTEWRPPALWTKDTGLKPKDLVGIPWMLAFALRADGWYLRSDVIWSKPNPMPESVTDRPTKAHEYIFLLSKSERYYYDADAILEPVSENTHLRISQNLAAQIGSERANGGSRPERPMKAVVRSPKDETRDEQGLRPSDRFGRGPGWRKRVEAGQGIKYNDSFDESVVLPVEARNKRSVWNVNIQGFAEAHFATFPEELIKPCILAGCPASGIVLDPFVGSGTTALVAQNLQCNAVGIELNPAYLEIAKRRLAQSVLSFTT